MQSMHYMLYSFTHRNLKILALSHQKMPEVSSVVVNLFIEGMKAYNCTFYSCYMSYVCKHTISTLLYKVYSGLSVMAKCLSARQQYGHSQCIICMCLPLEFESVQVSVGPPFPPF